MSCYEPIPAHQDRPGGVVRLYPEVGSANISLPCGSCLGCRTDRAVQWGRRCVHEASLYNWNCFLTLTYDDEHLPPGGHLLPEDLQLFMKRLREAVRRSADGLLSDRSRPVRFFACGEYGETSDRPHFHILLFNCSFSDGSACGDNIFVSRAVSKLWTFGIHRYGSVTEKSAQYVAGYSLKKHGLAPCDRDGVPRPRAFLRMSLKPGIGVPWLEKFADSLESGFTVVDGKPVAVPRSYRIRLQALRREYGPVSALVAHGMEVSEELEVAAASRGNAIRVARTVRGTLAASKAIHEARARLYSHSTL